MFLILSCLVFLTFKYVISIYSNRASDLDGFFRTNVATENGCTTLRLGNLKGRDHLEDLGVDGNIISEWMLGK
jgi:hypothetical protein